MRVGMHAVVRSCGLAVAVAGLLASRPVPAAAQQTVTLGGVFHTVWVDARRGPGSGPLYFVSGDGGTVRLEVDQADLAVHGGRQALERRRVTVTGLLQTGAAVPGQLAAAQPAILRVTSLRPEQALVAAAPQAGSRAYATILCRFPDIAALPGSRARYEAITGVSAPGLDHYWREVSEQAIDLTGTIVTNWYTLPQPYSYYADPVVDLGRLADDCTGVADADLNYAGFDGINMQFNATLPASWGGGWWLARDGVNRVMPTTWMADWAGQSVYAHEMGHSFGLPHSSGQYGQVYDSPWDVMSSAYVRFVGGTHDWIGQQTITYHKGLLGWIGERSLTVTENTVAATLERSAQPAAGALLEVRIPVDGTARFYTVEARRQVGYDTGLPREGVVIHLVNPGLAEPARVRDGDNNGVTDDAGSAWTEGETFWDAVERIAVRVESATPTGWIVRARRNAAVLTVTVEGPGRVSTVPGGISCPGDCSEPYGGGEPVALSAAPVGDAVFAGWGGACSGTGDCIVTAAEAASVSATFLEQVAVTVTVNGLGTVTSSPAGISCPDDCTESVLAGTTLTLTAVPADGVVFSGWAGACSGTGQCVVSPMANAAVTASFAVPVDVTSADARPGGTVGAAYTDQLEAAGGDGVYQWSLVSGALPEGIELSGAGGLAGVPEVAGAFAFTARAASGGFEATKEFTLTIGSPALQVNAVIDALIAPPPALTEDEQRYLDLQGNRNGRLDAGDVRAWLQRQALVSANRETEE